MTPPSIQSTFDQAVQLHNRREFVEAEKLFLEVIRSDPRHVDAMHCLGLLCHYTGRNREGVAWIEKAIAINPAVAELHYNLGIFLTALGEYDKAIAALEAAIRLRPRAIDAWCSLATAHRKFEDYDKAIAAVKTALVHQPNLTKAHNNLASYYRALGKMDQALACYDRALAIEPNDAPVASNRLYLLPFHPGFDSQAILRECRAFDEKLARPLAGDIRPHLNDQNPDRRLRVGFLSPDFRNHVQVYFTAPLLANLDRGDVEIHCYADVKEPDYITARLKTYGTVWRNVAGISDTAIADGIRSDRVDILVDLTMHMAGGRPLVFARKPAPVQVAWLAYPGTTGLSAMDYRLTDPHLDPGNDEDYSEKSLRLSDTFWCYDALAEGVIVQDLPALKNGFITFGCLNNFCKVTAEMLRIWGRVMNDVPNSRLMMMCPPGAHRSEVIQSLRVDQARVTFVPLQVRGDYLATYQRIDLALDTLPYNGHTTSLDAFWMGVPVVTLVGKTVVGRAGWSQLNNLQLKELAAGTEEDFVRIARELANDIPRLAEMRRSLRARMQQSPLMDAPRFARQMQGAFRTMWREYCNS
jgi:protein O-GlcNAc transferase